MRTTIAVISGLLLLLAIASCDLSGKQEIKTTEFIPLSLTAPAQLPDSVFLDPIRYDYQLRLHLRCSVEHSNQWSGLQFTRSTIGDTAFHFAAYAQLYYDGSDGNGIMVSLDTSFLVSYVLPEKRWADTTATQRIYIRLISPENTGTLDTIVLLHPKFVRTAMGE